MLATRKFDYNAVKVPVDFSNFQKHQLHVLHPQSSIYFHSSWDEQDSRSFERVQFWWRKCCCCTNSTLPSWSKAKIFDREGFESNFLINLTTPSFLDSWKNLEKSLKIFLLISKKLWYFSNLQIVFHQFELFQCRQKINSTNSCSF